VFSAGSRWGTLLAGAVVVLAGLAAYGNSLHGSFVYDDLLAIVHNPTIRQLWPLGPVLSPPCDNRSVTSRPLLNLSLAINYSLGGEDVCGYHAVNLAIHLANGLLMLGILRRTFQVPGLRRRFGRAGWRLSLAIAVLWTVHPLQTESVTYIIQRAESLAGLFYLLTLYSVVRGSQSPRRAWWYTVAAVACFLGVGVKEIVSTAPLVVLLYDRMFLANSFRKILQKRWGLYVGLLASWAFQLCLLARTGLPTLKEEVGSIGMWAYARSQPGVILHYLRLAFWPDPLCLDYGWPVASTLGEILPGALVLGVLGVVTIWGLAKRRGWGFLGAWFFLILAPTSSIMPLPHVAFEHRMYLPLAAVAALVVVGVEVAGGALVRWGWIGGRARILLSVGLWVAAVGGCTFLTVRRNETYASELAIWQDTVAKVPDNAWAHNAYGDALRAVPRPAEAIEHHRRALLLGKDTDHAHYGLALALSALGRFPEAVEHLQEALRIKPEEVEILNFLGVVLSKMGRHAEAIEHLEHALRINPKHGGVHNNLGNALSRLGRIPEAIEHHRQALQISPNDAGSHNNLGSALDRAGEFEEAMEHYRRASQLNPDEAFSHYNWGNTLLKLGRLEEAIQQFQQAVRIDPEHPNAERNLSSVLARVGRWREAAEHGDLAARLTPDEPELGSFVAWIMATRETAEGGNPSRAVELAERSCVMTGRHDVVCLDTLAAAYASAGRFADAIATANEARRLAESTGQASSAADIHMRLQLYRDGKPYREPAEAKRGS
jgi:tetratricopeptide (TPR) repeat protein